VKDLAQDVAEDVLGAMKDGSAKVLIVKVFILPIAICQLRTHAQHARPTREERAREGRTREGRGAGRGRGRDAGRGGGRVGRRGGRIAICQRRNPRQACP